MLNAYKVAQIPSVSQDWVFGFNDAMTNMHSQFGPAALWRELEKYAPSAQRWVVGYSGGLDSTTLLAALQALELSQPIVAIYVHHGLSSLADDWQAHAQAQCEQWGIEFRAVRVTVQNSGFGIEDAAREARYRAYKKEVKAGDVLLLGHHQDDQAETLLFRLLRGAGPRGLGAMVRERPFGEARLLRPLLGFSKAELEAYVRSRKLEWVTDDSNSENIFDRNFLRQQVMPLLASRWPGFAERWQHTAEACQAADRLSQDLASLDLEEGGERVERWGWSVDLGFCRQLPDYRRDNLLRYWTILHELPIMDRKALAEIHKQFFEVDEPSSRSCVQWGGAELRYFRDRLYLSRILPPLINQSPVIWSVSSPQPLPGAGYLKGELVKGGLRQSAQVEVRWREGGERCRPLGRQHSQTVKKLLQEYALEPWLRDRVPLIYLDGALAAVGDLWICEGFQAQPDDIGLRLTWQM